MELFSLEGNLVKHNSGCWKMLHKFLSQGKIFIGMSPDEKENAPTGKALTQKHSLFKRNNYSFILGRQI